jgi:hypothetical protein
MGLSALSIHTILYGLELMVQGLGNLTGFGVSHAIEEDSSATAHVHELDRLAAEACSFAIDPCIFGIRQVECDGVIHDSSVSVKAGASGVVAGYANSLNLERLQVVAMIPYSGWRATIVAGLG